MVSLAQSALDHMNRSPLLRRNRLPVPDEIGAGRGRPVFRLWPEKVVFKVPADDELPAEDVRVHRHTRVFKVNGEDFGSAQQLVETILSSERVEAQYGQDGRPEHTAFYIEQSFAERGPEGLLYIQKLQPLKLRPIHSIHIHGRAEFAKEIFPLEQGQRAKVRVTWFTGKRRKLSIRFGVRSAAGDKCSQVWKVVTERGRGRSDIYVTAHGLRKAFKISLHESGSWQYGLTEEYTRRPDSVRLAGTTGRHLEIWDRPTELAPGLTRAFQVVIPSAAARHNCVETENDVTWVTASGPEEAVEFNIVLTKPPHPEVGWPGKDSMGASLAGTFELENGERAWVIHRRVPLPKLKSLQIPAAAIQDVEFTDDAKYSIALLGCAEDGSRFLYDAPIDGASIKQAIESAASRNPDQDTNSS